MKHSKMIEMLKRFSAKALKRFEAFIASPYFNKNEKIKEYVLFLTKLAPKWAEEQLTDEAQFLAVFGKIPFDRQKLYYLRSDTTELLEAFLMQEHLNINQIDQELVLLDFYLKENLSEYFEIAYKKCLDILKKEKIRDGKYYYDYFRLNWLEIVYQEMVQQGKGNFRYQEQQHILDIFYLTNTLSLHISSLSTSAVLSVKKNESLPLKTLLKYVEKGDAFLNIPIIQLLYHHAKMLLEPDNELLVSQSLGILEANLAQLPAHTLTAMFSIIRNRYVAYINQGNKSYEAKLLHLYKKQIQSDNILDSKGELPTGVFNNIITLVLRAKDFEWFELLINRYSDKLPALYRESTVHFAHAKHQFSRQNYPLVLQHLTKMENYSDVFTDINTRKLLAQTYYALAEIENVGSTLNTFRVFLSRNKNLSEKNKDFYLNFAAAMTKLISLDKTNFNKIKKYISFIEELNPPEKTWFIEQVSEHFD